MLFRAIVFSHQWEIGPKSAPQPLDNSRLWDYNTNIESEHNTTAHAAKINDGGFYYTVAAGGNSQAGNTEDGGLRSYGSMTYAGLKSMLYAGVKPDEILMPYSQEP